MKFILIVLTVFGLFFVSACPEVKNSASESNYNLDSAKINSVVNSQNEHSNTATPSETPIQKSQFTPTEPMAWVGYVRAKTVKDIEKTFSLQNGSIDDNPNYNKIGMTTDVDIFNCAGYLMSGQAQKDGDFNWEFALTPETVVPDAIEKMKQCDDTSDKEREQKNLWIGNNIFAVALTEKTQKNFRVAHLDTTGTFAELPSTIQRKLNATSLATDEAIRRSIKGEISSENHDQFADIDGDGKIDLIYIQQLCREPEHPDLDGCDFLLMKINGKWKIVGVMNMA